MNTEQWVAQLQQGGFLPRKVLGEVLPQTKMTEITEQQVDGKQARGSV